MLTETTRYTLFLEGKQFTSREELYKFWYSMYPVRHLVLYTIVSVLNLGLDADSADIDPRIKSGYHPQAPP